MHLVGCSSMNIQELGHAIQSSGPLTQVGTPPKIQNCHYLLYTTKFLHYTFVCEVERVKKKDTEGGE